MNLVERADVVVLLAALTAIGVGIGVAVLPDGWTLAARVSAGIGLGLGSTITVFANRMIGGLDFE
ncbi:MAG: hypothetical protein ABMB14_14360 [Myxococcota bacterium]